MKNPRTKKIQEQFYIRDIGYTVKKLTEHEMKLGGKCNGCSKCDDLLISLNSFKRALKALRAGITVPTEDSGLLPKPGKI